MASIHHVGAGPTPGSSAGAVTALNHCVISPVLLIYSLSKDFFVYAYVSLSGYVRVCGHAREDVRSPEA